MLHPTPFTIHHIPAAVALDKKWFGEYGISAHDLTQHIEKHPDSIIALMDGETLHGFATFELLNNRMPTDYVGEFPQNVTILFINQFTTSTNYNIHDWSADTALLAAVEEQARTLGATAVAEALDKNHPYSTEQNPEFDAFGFYEKQGYTIDRDSQLAWQPDEQTRVECVLVRKSI